LTPSPGGRESKGGVDSGKMILTLRSLRLCGKGFMGTIRQKIIDLLEEDARDARELSQTLRVPEKELYNNLAHVAKSMNAKKKKLEILPFSCLSCGYVFKDRRRFTRPGRCPKCRDTRVEYPLYRIR